MLEIVINVTGLLFLSALFSGAETAFTSLSQTKVEVIRKDGKFASKIVAWLYDRLDVVIIVNLILSNFVNILLSAYITLLATSGADNEGAGLGYAVATGTILILVFGEILPKKIAILFPVAFCRFSAYLLYFLYHIFYPIVIPVSKAMKLFDKLALRGGKGENSVAEEDVEAMLVLGQKDGALETKEYEMIRKLLLLNDKEVKDIMTRRTDVIAISKDAKLRELLQIASENKLSRIPVYEYSVDQIDWVISIPKVIPFLIDSANLDKKVSHFKPHKAFKVPESKIIDDLFFEFQRKRVHMAIVLDEYGETSGLITLEDIVEEIFGDIEDETDEKEIKIEKIGKLEAKADGDVTIEEILDMFGIEVDNEDYPNEKTLSWLILEILHRFPKQGEKINIPQTNIELTVLDMDDEYIDKVGVKVII